MSEGAATFQPELPVSATVGKSASRAESVPYVSGGGRLSDTFEGSPRFVGWSVCLQHCIHTSVEPVVVILRTPWNLKVAVPPLDAR